VALRDAMLKSSTAAHRKAHQLCLHAGKAKRESQRYGAAVD
jgi:hypothetical protein